MPSSLWDWDVRGAVGSPWSSDTTIREEGRTEDPKVQMSIFASCRQAVRLLLGTASQHGAPGQPGSEALEEVQGGRGSALLARATRTLPGESTALVYIYMSF